MPEADELFDVFDDLGLMESPAPVSPKSSTSFYRQPHSLLFSLKLLN